MPLLTTQSARGYGFSSLVTPVSTNAFESIATTFFTSAGSTVTFNSIPQTFKHLQLRYTARTTNVTTGANLYVVLNGDTASNYSWHRLQAYGNGITTDGYGSQTAFGVAGLMSGASSIANAFGTGILDIVDYTNTNKLKTMKSLSGYENNGNGSPGNDQGYHILASSLWFKAGSGVTGDAVTSMTLTINGGGNFAANSHFALYGIKG